MISSWKHLLETQALRKSFLAGIPVVEAHIRGLLINELNILVQRPVRVEDWERNKCRRYGRQNQACWRYAGGRAKNYTGGGVETYVRPAVSKGINTASLLVYGMAAGVRARLDGKYTDC